MGKSIQFHYKETFLIRPEELKVDVEQWSQTEISLEPLLVLSALSRAIYKYCKKVQYF